MSFEIHNPQDEAINLSELDKEAAAFWGKEAHPSNYAAPLGSNKDDASVDEILKAMRGNWYDIIGWNIHHQSSNWTSGWNNIKASMWSVVSTSMYEYIFLEDDTLTLHIEGAKAYLKPYFQLIDYWESKGYKPVQVKD